MVAIMRGSLMFYDTFEPVIIILGWNLCCNNIAGAAIVFGTFLKRYPVTLSLLFGLADWTRPDLALLGIYVNILAAWFEISDWMVIGAMVFWVASGDRLSNQCAVVYFHIPAVLLFLFSCSMVADHPHRVALPLPNFLTISYFLKIGQLLNKWNK